MDIKLDLTKAKYNLSTDVVNGFYTSVMNNQVSLALDYARQIIEALLETSDQMERRLSALERLSSPSKPQATARKRTPEDVKEDEPA